MPSAWENFEWVYFFLNHLKRCFRMANKKKDKILPRVEMIIIGVFAVSFMIWMISRCNTNRGQLIEDETQTLTVEEEEALSPAAQVRDTPTAKKEEEAKPEPPKREISTIKEKIVPLYVTIDDLKLRDKPNLQGRVLTSLELFEEVTFLNEITEFRQKLNLGFEIAEEPWVKIKTERGYIGWVYGAGVHFYKKKRDSGKKEVEKEEEQEEGQ